MKRSLAIWAAIVVPMWVVLVLCTHWEPIMGDGWGHYFHQRDEGMSWFSLYDFARASYLDSNPRLGQVWTLIVYTPGPWHSIVTPIVELSCFGLLTALVLGRWPSVRRIDDALLFATIIALTAVTTPEFGQMLFYRPYTGNYVFGLVINLAFLVPYRFQLEQPRRRGWWWIPIMTIVGFASGLCNEHTGPTIVALALAATLACRGERPGAWAIAGIVGMIAGGLALFYAPGQSVRYDALATHGSMAGRIIDRGLAGNAQVIGMLLVYLWPALLWLALAMVARMRSSREEGRPITRQWAELAIGAGAFAIALTLLVSPKVGARLYLGSTALASTAIAGWVVRQLASTWSRAIAGVFAAVVFVVVGWKCLGVYREVGPEFVARLDVLQHAPANSVAELPRYTVERSRWFFGDDLENEHKRNSVSFSFSLALIKMTGQRPATVAPEDP